MYQKILIICFLFSLNIFADNKNDARNSGLNSAQSVISKYGSKSRLNENISAPMQGTRQLSTIDNLSSFDTEISNCAENNDGIKLVFNPMSNGLLNVNISQDTNASGNYNYSLQLSSIENICSGGFKSSNGKNYKYNFNINTKTINLVEVSKNEMRACFCITNACNFGAYNKSLADKITGDIIGTIGSSGIANYHIGINRYDEASKTYYLYVKNNSSCKDSNLGNKYTNTNPTQYYHNQDINTITLSDVVNKDSNKSDSLYYSTSNLNSTLINSNNNNSSHSIKIKDEKICIIKNEPFLNENKEIRINEKNSCSDDNINNCTLHREEICDNSGRNCINKILNKQITSNSIPVSCQTFDEKHQVCADGNTFFSVSNMGRRTIKSSNQNSYFYIKRYYDCGKQDLNYDSSKSNKTFSSVSKSGSTLNYVDFNGQSQNIDIGEFDNCQIRWCRVKINDKHTQVYTDGTSNVSTKDGVSTIEFEYKRCNTLANGSYICPKESNETILEDCTCNLNMDSANMAIGYASAVEDAIKDFVCSDK